MSKIINPGKYNKKISIYSIIKAEDNAGFKTIESKSVVLNTYASVKTTKGFTLLVNNSDFEKVYTNFTIRYPKVKITRDMLIDYDGNTYSIEYLNNIDENNIELEIQAKLVDK